jgi:hypothetical protein
VRVGDPQRCGAATCRTHKTVPAAHHLLPEGVRHNHGMLTHTLKTRELTRTAKEKK